MRLVAVVLAVASVGVCAAQAAESNKPDWAYAVPPPVPANAAPGQRPPPDLSLLSIAGSKFHFTRNKVQGIADDGSRARVAPADWFPEEHGVLPPLVALGDPGRGITACSLCHMPEGRGRSENAAVAGLPAAYFVEQLHDMKSGARQSAEPGKVNARQMADFAKAMTEDEIQAAADYYAAIPWVKWSRVVETATVPKTESLGGMWVPLTGAKAGTEPLGERIIEVPADPEATELRRDPHSGFIAYVPSARWRRGSVWPAAAAMARRWLVLVAMARVCWAWATRRKSPAAPPAISPASFTTSRPAPGTAQARKR
jgi:cytochrome c553